MSKKSSKKESSSGDHYTVNGNISGGVVVQGPDAKVSVHNEGMDAKELSALFEQVYQKISERSEDPNVDKEEIEQKVKQIEAEAAKGEQADPTMLQRWLKNLDEIAPDIVDVIAASLGGPVSVFTVVFKKIVERARKQAGTTG
jgi:vacuolar-type H+-ATPase subunit E/Vma4